MRIVIDGLVGEGIFFITEGLELAPSGNEQRCAFTLSPSAARELASDQYRHLLLEHGLRNKSNATVGNIFDPEQMLFPYWIGYFREGESYDFKALDGVSGEIQGVRMRRVFLRALRQLEQR